MLFYKEKQTVSGCLPIFPSSLAFLSFPRFNGVKMKGPELVDSPSFFNLTGSKCGLILINLKDLFKKLQSVMVIQCYSGYTMILYLFLTLMLNNFLFGWNVIFTSYITAC